MTIEKNAIRNEPSGWPAWLIIAIILVFVAFTGISLVMDRL